VLVRTTFPPAGRAPGGPRPRERTRQRPPCVRRRRPPQTATTVMGPRGPGPSGGAEQQAWRARKATHLGPSRARRFATRFGPLQGRATRAVAVAVEDQPPEPDARRTAAPGLDASERSRPSV